MKKLYTILTADFECWMCNNCNFNHDSAKVWLAGWKELYSEKLHAFNNIEDWFFNILENVDNPVVYFHNGGKYDTFFIFKLLISQLGFLPVENIKEIKIKDRMHFKNFSSNGTTYDISIFYKNKKMIIRDSYRLVSKSIERLGGKTKGKFNDFEKYAHKEIKSLSELSEQELDTFNEDIDVMRKHLQADLFYGKIPGKKEILPMTIASIGYKDQKENVPFVSKNLYHKLSLKQWDYFINFFRGGIVYTNPKFVGKIITGKIYHYDVNSLYPYTLKNEKLPFGSPMKYKPICGDYVTCYKILIKSAKIKKNKLHYIGVYKSNFTSEDNWIQELDEDAYNYPDKIFNLTYYVFDFELDWIKKQYTIDFEIQQTDYFQTKNYMRDWVEKYETLKIHYTKTEDEVNRDSVKLILNGGGFGKYGQKRTSRSNVFKKITEQEKDNLRKNSIVYQEANSNDYWHFTTEITTESEVNNLKYCVLASFITAKSRIYISKFRQEYYQWFIYGDTDDMYLLNKQIDEQYIDCGERKGQFGLFSFNMHDDFWEKMYIHGSKKYRVERSDRNLVKFAGFTYYGIKMTFEEFVNLDMLKDAKTFKKYRDGVPTIHKRDGILRKKSQNNSEIKKIRNIMTY